MSAPAPLRIPVTARGPRESGNGGWTCGSVAVRLDPGGAGAVRIRLSAPPPLETDLALTAVVLPDGTQGLRLSGPGKTGTAVADTTVAEAGVVTDDLPLVPAQDDDPERAFALASEAAAGFGGLTEHPFPECFACGTTRAEGDGLRLRPGPVGDGTTSTAWVPHAAFDSGDGFLDVPTTWAGLDCPGGWSADIRGRPMVLGTMTARVARRPRVGERCVVRGRAEPTGRRTVPAWTTLYGADGAVLAVASQIWVVIRT